MPLYVSRGICPYMVVKHRKKHGKVYLEEYKSIRVNGKVKSIYVKSLGPEKPVNKKKPTKTVIDRLEPGPSHRAGDVTLLWRLAQDLDMANIIDGICCEEKNVEGPSPGKMLTTWAINRVLDPTSATMLEEWVPRTDIPWRMGLDPSDFTKDAFLSSLDFVCYRDKWIDGFQDHTSRIDDALYRKWRELYPLEAGEKETLAYDLTSVLFFGITCPLAELGYNTNHIKRVQVRMALIISRKEKQPISHFVYNGGRNEKATIKNLVSRMQESSIESGTIIWDRGNVSAESVNDVEDAGWELICGIPMTSKEARDIIKNEDVKCSWKHLVKTSKAGHIYAMNTQQKLYGKQRHLTIYTNRERGVRDGNSRNEALVSIEEALIELNETGSAWTEKKLHGEIGKIVGDFKRFITVRVRRKGDGPRISWEFKEREIKDAEKADGKYLLLGTDESLSAKEIVNAYLEKDFIEKVFRSLKTSEEVQPVRHRLEERVRAYLFVCVLAYRLNAYLQHRLKEISDKENSWETADSLLNELGRVERVQIKLGNQVKTWYLNLSQKTKETLKKMGLGDLFQETTEVDLSFVGGKKF